MRALNVYTGIRPSGTHAMSRQPSWLVFNRMFESPAFTGRSAGCRLTKRFERDLFYLFPAIVSDHTDNTIENIPSVGLWVGG